MTKPITDGELRDAITGAIWDEPYSSVAEDTDGYYSTESVESMLNLIKSYAKDYAEMVVGSDEHDKKEHARALKGDSLFHGAIAIETATRMKLRAEQRERMQ